jgi:predicted SAM-dependent methyltransferase
MILDVARKKREGCIGIDMYNFNGVDIIADITKRIPEISDETADFVCCSHVIEHIPYPFFWDAIKEMIRVLKVGGSIEIITPHPGNDSAMVPDHKHWFSKLYYKNMRDNPLPNMVVDEIIMRRTPYFSKIKILTGFADEVIENCFRNTIEEIIIKGRKV